MGKVQSIFNNGSAGAISRSVDDIVISLRNVGDTDIAFGDPVFLASGGAEPFNISTPQAFTAFLGFAVRVADKTPDNYPSGQFNQGTENGVWHSGDVMEILVRGSIVVAMSATGAKGGAVYLRKADGKLTNEAGDSGTTVLLSNVHIKQPRTTDAAYCEVVVNERNIL